ncbi:FAD-dependent monooxygenase [Variovorax dokdonensis]|uniref:FAD-dependent monooxygenase n=1 Tax=Variovorax dokdonensis TaxID=344883 RepID=A0ABT7N6V5_9BURK|nr:FAD-dependent monooxygenase [Variovorax dokdonensis]MDM0043610.1 FAD-dependent monooxygenase [Variovorax dokdonensis]
MAADVLIAGGGIGGLAAAIAMAHRGHRVEVLEQSAQFSEVGAGIQLGPNVTRRLRELGVLEQAQSLAATPQALAVHGADSGRLLARLPLADEALRKYGSPYLCIHRADLHRVLLDAAMVHAGVTLNTGACITQVAMREHNVAVGTQDMRAWEGDGLLGADGLWSTVRPHVLEAAVAPNATGHTAWRALYPMADLPPSLRSTDVRVWLGERMHAVAYPVRGGDSLNVVVLAEDQPAHRVEAAGSPRDWDQQANLDALRSAVGHRCEGVRPLIDAIPRWRAWSLHDRPPLRGAKEMARERMALLGDAAHPMLPYLAQGAGMAIEDAATLGECLRDANAISLPDAFARYAAMRWQRNARVQQRSLANAEIFHAGGAMRLARDAALRVLGTHLLDAPWLYRG